MGDLIRPRYDLGGEWLQARGHRGGGWSFGVCMAGNRPGTSSDRTPGRGWRCTQLSSAEWAFHCYQCNALRAHGAISVGVCVPGYGPPCPGIDDRQTEGYSARFCHNCFDEWTMCGEPMYHGGPGLVMATPQLARPNKRQRCSETDSPGTASPWAQLLATRTSAWNLLCSPFSSHKARAKTPASPLSGSKRQQQHQARMKSYRAKAKANPLRLTWLEVEKGKGRCSIDLLRAYASELQRAGHDIMIGGRGLRDRLVALYKHEGWTSWAYTNANDQ